MKQCNQCLKQLPATLEYFYQHTSGKNGLRSQCKECMNTNHHQYTKSEKYKIYRRKYYHINRDKLSCSENACRASRKWKKNNRTHINQYRCRRIMTDERYAVINRLRIRLSYAYRTYSQNGKIGSSNNLGINWQSICEHLGPCPGPRNQYHIDHITPLCQFDFDNPEQIQKAFAPENHQWLLATQNLSKGGKTKEGNICQ